MAIKIFSPVLKHKRTAAAILVVAILAAGGAVALKSRMSASSKNTAEENLAYARTVFLKKEDLNESVNVSGIVQSAKVSSVTTSLSNKVTALNVKVGDHVNKGDVICTLDDTDIRRAIQDKEKEMGEEKQRLQDAYNKASAQVEEARRAKDNEKKNQDTLVEAARAARDKAASALSAVTPAYETAKANYQVMEQAVSSAQSAVDAAADARQKAYDAWIAAGGTTEAMPTLPIRMPMQYLTRRILRWKVPVPCIATTAIPKPTTPPNRLMTRRRRNAILQKAPINRRTQLVTRHWMPVTPRSIRLSPLCRRQTSS